jgi:DNA-binding transcriptional MerR regulator
MEKRYTISDAAKQLELEAHALRYWEVELGLHIERNAQGHRFYTAEDILLLRRIKDLKELGFQLKAIKMILPDIHNVCQMDTPKLYRLREELNQQVMEDNYRSASQHTAQVMPLHPERTNLSQQKPDAPSASAEEKLRHFEAMMRKMIRAAVAEMEHESEERICEKITTKLLKEMDYLTRQRDELQERQIALLNQILAQIRHELPESAASSEESITQLQSRHKDKPQKHKKKLFAKSNQ